MQKFIAMKAILFVLLGVFIGYAYHPLSYDPFVLFYSELILLSTGILITVLFLILIHSNQRTSVALLQANHFLDSVIDNIPHMIFVKDAKNLNFVRMNKAGLALFGAASSDVIGKNDFDFFPLAQAEFFMAKDRQTLETSTLVDIPCESFTSNQKQGLRYLHTVKVPILDASGEPLYLLGISEDITERKALERDLQESVMHMDAISQDARTFQMAVEASTDGILITNVDTTIAYANPAWLTMNKYALSDIIGRKPSIIMSNRTDEDTVRAMKEAIRLGKPFYTEEAINQRSDGSTYSAELSIYPVWNRGKDAILFFVSVLHDITARKRMDDAKSEFVSLASHQLRTPLTAIRLALDRLKKLDHHTTRKECRSIIVHAAQYGEQMAETIQTMLNISRLESGSFHQVTTSIRIGDLLRQVIDEPRTYIRHKKLECTLEADPHLVYETDAVMLREIVANIFGNAIKYSPKGGSVSVRASLDDGALTIAVQDAGVGIPESEREKVFQKFYRGSNTSHFHQNGTGLGLYFVRLAVECLGGSVSFTTKEDHGTLFTLVLPPSPHAT